MMANLIAAFFYYTLLLPISYLPFGVLYLVSDALSWVAFHVIGYRKQVVLGQLRSAFPHKSEAEIQVIARDFYHHLSDLLIESIKLFTLSPQEAARRFVCRNPALVNGLAAQGHNIIIAAGHYNNFELAATTVDQLIDHRCIALYQPLNNRFFDQKIRESRGRLGTGLLSKTELKHFLDHQLVHQTQPVALLFAMDQSPTDPHKAHWMHFLNQDTGVQFGTEKYAKDYNLSVVYGRIFREKRGFYTFEFEVVTQDARNAAPGEITERMTHLLEADIKRAPAFWLWSHRRWKHPRPERTN
jgi:Kdo2-lipid IVA lauroyltransferase/acyltransferase